ncbi:hypothetical protein ACSS6W_005545 [Trichoderma asperelloides]
MDKAKCTDDSHATRDGPNCSAECHAQLLTSLASSDEALKTAIGLINLALLDQDRDVLGALPDKQEHIHRQQRFSTTPAVAFPAATASGFPKEGFRTITIKTSFSSIPSIVHGLAASDLSATHLAIPAESPKYQHHQRSTVANQVSSTTKVTIGVSVMVGVLVIIGFIGWHLRMKIRFRNKKRISRPTKPISPPTTPLISPSSSHAAPPKAPLTPPARLQERRFLLPRALSLRRNNQRRRFDGPSSQDKAGMPLAPLSPLSISKARRCPEEGERQGITSTTSISLTTSPTRPPRDDTPSETSISSVFSHVGTVRAASNASINSAQNKYNSATIIELPRPPLRAYEAPPAAGRLASPGPPPTRALPSLPLDGRTSPLKSPLSPTSPTRRGSPSIASISGSSVSVSEGSGDSQRLREGNSSHRDSRGSVEVALQSPRRVRHVRSPLLNEVRLDKVL